MSNSLGSFLLAGLMQPLLGTIQNWTSKKRKEREDEFDDSTGGVCGLRPAAGGASGGRGLRRAAVSRVPSGCLLRQGGRIIPLDSAPEGGSGRANLAGLSAASRSGAPAAKRRRGSAGKRLKASSGGLQTSEGPENSAETALGLPANGQERQDAEAKTKRGKAPKRKLKKGPQKDAISELTGSENRMVPEQEALHERALQASERALLCAENGPRAALSVSASRLAGSSVPADVGGSSHVRSASTDGFLREAPGEAAARNGSAVSSAPPLLPSGPTLQKYGRPGSFATAAFPSVLSASSALSAPSSSFLLTRTTSDAGERERDLRRPQPASLPSSLDSQVNQRDDLPGSASLRLLAQPIDKPVPRSDISAADGGLRFAGDRGEGAAPNFQIGREADEKGSNSQLSRFLRPLSSLSAASSSTAASAKTCGTSRSASSACESFSCAPDAGAQEIVSSSMPSTGLREDGVKLTKNVWGLFGEGARLHGEETVDSCCAGHQLSAQNRDLACDVSRGGEDKENQALQDDDGCGESRERTEVFGHRVLRPLRSKNLHENYDALIDIVAFAKRRCERETMELLRKDVQILYYARGLHHPSHVKTFQRQHDHAQGSVAPAVPPSASASSSSLPSVTAALAAGAHPHSCPSWATREELRAAVRRQDELNPFTVFGEAPPELVLSEIYDQRHYTHVSAQTRASHPVISRLAATHSSGDATRAQDDEEERQHDLQKRQLQDSLRERTARREITPEEAKRLWMEAMEEFQRKRAERGAGRGRDAVSQAIQQELVKYGFARQLDVSVFRERLLPALEAWWKGQCDVELDWRHDPLTSEECVWYAEAMQALTDATEVMTVKQLCFCPTPPPYKPWSWTDSRFRLRQKTEARKRERALRQRRRSEEDRQGQVEREAALAAQDPWKVAQTPPASGFCQGADGRGCMSARKRSRARGRCAGEGIARQKSSEAKGVQEGAAGSAFLLTYGPGDEGRTLSHAALGREERLGLAGGGARGDNDASYDPLSEGSPITPQIRRGVGGQLVVITRRAGLSQEHASRGTGAEGPSGACDVTGDRESKRLKPSTAGGTTPASFFPTKVPSSFAPAVSSASSTSGTSTWHFSSAFLGAKSQGLMDSRDAGVANSASAAWAAAKHRGARAYHCNTPPKKTGMRSALERRAAATAAAAAAAVTSWTGSRPHMSPDTAIRMSPGFFSNKTLPATQWWPRSQAFKGSQLFSPFSTAVNGGKDAKAPSAFPGLSQEARALGQKLPAATGSGSRAGLASAAARPAEGLWTRMEQAAARQAGKSVYCRPLAAAPKARLSIGRVYGVRHDLGRAPYSYWSAFADSRNALRATGTLAGEGAEAAGPMRRRSKGRAEGGQTNEGSCGRL
ncbi:hypothetical protein BESB_079290 [Besnoitia besnoiti]|uniref:Inner centromere protein ARK-binding domain-containing protein n=1 Tax=Besnoitia besnoiti TaxID=94643 RepID=A0A2A9MDF1_BESBE|nr:hypothetical protein BESB_079290 [Besnoitia besnoiti]PFH33713.1 hypothetical protein BESB_079290 [Besnoitia besnoiti]